MAAGIEKKIVTPMKKSKKNILAVSVVVLTMLTYVSTQIMSAVEADRDATSFDYANASRLAALIGAIVPLVEWGASIEETTRTEKSLKLVMAGTTGALALQSIVSWGKTLTVLERVLAAFPNIANMTSKLYLAISRKKLRTVHESGSESQKMVSAFAKVLTSQAEREVSENYIEGMKFVENCFRKKFGGEYTCAVGGAPIMPYEVDSANIIACFIDISERQLEIRGQIERYTSDARRREDKQKYLRGINAATNIFRDLFSKEHEAVHNANETRVSIATPKTQVAPGKYQKRTQSSTVPFVATAMNPRALRPNGQTDAKADN